MSVPTYSSINATKFTISSMDPPPSKKSSTIVVSMQFWLNAMRASDNSAGNKGTRALKSDCSGITLANFSSSSPNSATQLYNAFVQIKILVANICWNCICPIYVWLDLFTSRDTGVLVGKQTGCSGIYRLPKLEFLCLHRSRWSNVRDTGV